MKKKKKISFIRWGGLSAVNQKARYIPEHKLEFYNRPESEIMTYHRPPAKKGLYCFVEGFVEMFLVGWKIYDDEGKLKKEFEHPRKFDYTGKIWTHLHHPTLSTVQYFRKHDEWYETHTDCLPDLIKEEIKQLNKSYFKEYSKDFGWKESERPDFSSIVTAHKAFGIDHFEMFIEKIN